MRKTLKIGAIVFCVALLMACLFAFELHAAEGERADGETVTLSLDEGEFFDFYRQEKDNAADSANTDHRIICIVDLDWLFEAAMTEVEIVFTNEDGTVRKTLSVTPSVVYTKIIANVDGETVTYHADEGLAIFGWIVTDVPDEIFVSSATIRTGSEGLKYTYNSATDSYIVSGIGSCSDTEIVIPNIYKGKPVTSIGDEAFYECTSLTSITIPDSVTSIGDYAFEYCISLTSITLPDSVTSIGDHTFCWCCSLTSITLPDSVTSIGDEAFSICTNLTSITIGNSVTSIGDYAFSNCDSLTNITIPDSVTTIGDGAFAECTSLTGINVSENNPNYCSIDGVLYNKDQTKLIAAPGAIQAIVIPNSVTSIGDHAFSCCESLTSITLPDSVTSIGDYAFNWCTSLTSITIPDNVTSIGDWAFSTCTNLTSITIGNSVTSIGDYAFSNCDSLTNITIPDSVTTIGDDAFNWCTSLTSITIGNGVTSIGDGAFGECTSLTSVTIGTGVTSIGDSAFYWCESLTSITLPDSVTSIGGGVFYECASLARIYCEADSQPAGWDKKWLYKCNATVLWGNTWEYVNGVPTLK